MEKRVKSMWFNFIFILVFIFIGGQLRASENCQKVYSSSTITLREYGFPSVLGLPQFNILKRSGTFILALDTQVLEATVNPSIHGRQRKDLWCWAACTQMTLNAHGFRVLQEDIVLQTFGALVNKSATGYQVRDALSGWVVRSATEDEMYVSRADLVPTDPVVIYDTLKQFQKPMVVGLSGAGVHGGTGHGVIITGITYDVHLLTGQMIPRTVIIRDPWPDSPSRQEMDWSEFSRRADWILKMSFWRAI
jgi:hypothetical protein